VVPVGAKDRLQLGEQKEVALDVRRRHVDAEMGEESLPAARRQSLEAGHDQHLAGHAQQLRDCLDRANEVLEDLGGEDDVECLVGEGQAVDVEGDRVVELAVNGAAVGQVQRVGEVGVIRVDAVALAHQVRVVVESRTDVDEGREVEALEPAKDLELAQQRLKGERIDALHVPLGVVDTLLGISVTIQSAPVRVLEPRAGALLDGVSRVRVPLHRNFLAISREEPPRGGSAACPSRACAIAPAWRAPER
jgi:hypothetical protein